MLTYPSRSIFFLLLLSFFSVVVSRKPSKNATVLLSNQHHDPHRGYWSPGVIFPPPIQVDDLLIILAGQIPKKKPKLFKARCKNWLMNSQSLLNLLNSNPTRHVGQIPPFFGALKIINVPLSTGSSQLYQVSQAECVEEPCEERPSRHWRTMGGFDGPLQWIAK